MNASNSTIAITVCYGNHNKYTIDVESNTPVGKLVYYLTRLLKKSHKDVLYMIINGHIVGTDALPLKRELADCTVNSRCTAHLIFRDSEIEYPDADLYRNQQYNNYITKQIQIQTQTQTSSDQSQSQSQSDLSSFQEALRSLGIDLNLSALEDVHVTIPEDEYEQYITQVDPDMDIDDTCLCGQDISRDDAVQLGCNHIFHNSCIRESLTTSSVRCPRCNYDVRDQS